MKYSLIIMNVMRDEDFDYNFNLYSTHRFLICKYLFIHFNIDVVSHHFSQYSYIVYSDMCYNKI